MQTSGLLEVVKTDSENFKGGHFCDSNEQLEYRHIFTKITSTTCLYYLNIRLMKYVWLKVSDLEPKVPIPSDCVSGNLTD